jgi:hypothetical protein
MAGNSICCGLAAAAGTSECGNRRGSQWERHTATDYYAYYAKPGKPKKDKNDKKHREGAPIPPQKLSGTLLAAIATVWNGLPEAIKSEQSETSTIIFLLHSAVTYNRDKFEV